MTIYIIILIIFFIFFLFFLNKSYQQNIKENFGVYCGKYNTNIYNAKKLCKNDTNCKWIESLNNDGITSGWCSQV